MDKEHAPVHMSIRCKRMSLCMIFPLLSCGDDEFPTVKPLSELRIEFFTYPQRPIALITRSLLALMLGRCGYVVSTTLLEE